jgi:2-deoxy-D-gluconate 3-dehydrogenase
MKSGMNELMSLHGRVALVTGGNSGIGLGMCRGLARAGAALAIAGRNSAKNDAAARELQALGAQVLTLQADVTREADCLAIVQATRGRYERLDILVNNAGVNIRKAPQDYSLQDWTTVIETNLTSAFLCSQAAYPALVASGGGKIINIGSMTSIFGASFAAPYSASKGGVVQLSKALATAWAKDNIQVNAILPGWVDTDLTRQARKDVAGLHERVLARTPAGRWGEPVDFEGIAVFLSSRASDFISGAAIPVDGGYSSQA